jgi:hypothetical protein
MTEENPNPVPLCPPKLSNGLDTDGTLVSSMIAGEQPSLRPLSPASYRGANRGHPKTGYKIFWRVENSRLCTTHTFSIDKMNVVLSNISFVRKYNRLITWHSYGEVGCASLL